MKPNSRSWIWALLTLLPLTTGALLMSCDDPEQILRQTLQAKLDPRISSYRQKVVQEDLKNLGRISLSHPKDDPYFAQIFGGNTGVDVLRYLDERIQVLLNDDVQLSQVVEPKMPSLMYEKTEAPPAGAPKNIEFLAANMGGQIWFESVVSQTPARFVYGKWNQPINSTRSGIILLGKAYRSSRDDSFLSPSVPAIYRQALLVHEARHSDCTGGVTEKDLDIARNAKSHKDFLEQFPKKACGHWHDYCPKGHAFYGYLACDSHPWGSYSIEAAFASAMAHQIAFKNDPRERAEARMALAVAIDSWSRLTIDAKDVQSGKFGGPDMRSLGILPSPTSSTSSGN